MEWPSIIIQNKQLTSTAHEFIIPMTGKCISSFPVRSKRRIKYGGMSDDVIIFLFIALLQQFQTAFADALTMSNGISITTCWIWLLLERFPDNLELIREFCLLIGRSCSSSGSLQLFIYNPKQDLVILALIIIHFLAKISNLSNETLQ